MQHYLKYRGAEYVLCVCAAASLVATICAGFVLEDSLSANAGAIFLLAAVLQALLLLFAYRKLTVGIGIAVGVVLAVAAVVYIQTRHPMTNETENSLFLFLLIGVLTSLLVFLLGRSRAGVIALFLAGNLVIAGAHFLQFPAPLWGALLFPLACGFLLLYRVYMVMLGRAVLGKIRLGRYLRQTVLVVLCAAVFAGGLFWGVIRPLHPPTQELKLITTLKSMQIMERLGVSSVKMVFDPQLSSTQDPERPEQDNAQAQQDPTEGTQPSEIQAPQSLPEMANAEAAPINYDLSGPNYLWLLLLIPLAVIGAFVGRLLYKRHWREQVQKLSRQDAVVNYYRFFLRRLKKIGLGKPAFHTLREYADGSAHKLEAFQAGEVSFAMLTQVYEKAVYGGGEVTDEEYQAFFQFYQQFYPNLRRALGWGKYYLQVFRF